MRRILTVIPITFLLGAAALSAASDNTIHRTFAVGEGGTLRLEARFGEVRVATGGSGVTVDVRREVGTGSSDEALRNHKVTFEQSGNDVVVRSDYEHRGGGWFDWVSPLRVRYVIQVPSRYNVALQTSGGDIQVADLDGNAECRTSGGSVKLGRIGAVRARTSGGNISIGSASGAVSAQTSGGSIDIQSSANTVDAKTSGGSIDIGHATGPVVARTSGGSIDIRDSLDSVDAVTSGGSISARIARQPRGESRLSTSGGDVVVDLASNVGVDLDAHASGGSIQADAPVTVVGSVGRNELNGKINGGGPRLVLKSSGGGVRIRRF